MATHPRSRRAVPLALTAVTVAALAAVAAPADAAVAAAYTIRDISLADSPYSIGYGINAAGDAVVHQQISDPTALYGYRYVAYRVSGNTSTRLDSSDRPWAINGSGVVAGESSDGMARVWPGGSTAGPPSEAGTTHDVADNGTAVGLVYDAGNSRAAIFSPAGDVTRLAMPAGADRSDARAINESGAVVGYVESFGTSDPVTGAWITEPYSEAIEWDPDGNPTILTNVGLTGSAIAQDIDEAGDVLIRIAADTSMTLIRNADGSTTTVHAFGDFIEPDRMNDNRQVVGRAGYPGGSPQTAFLYDANTDTAYDLQNLIPAGSGWQLVEAEDINNAGQIVGYGYLNGRMAAFEMTPVGAEPGSVTGTVTNGGTVTTDPGGQGATAAVPVQTSITAPSGVSGTLSATLHDTTTSTPSGFALFGKEIDLSGPAASTAQPYVVTFTVDSSLLGGLLPSDVQVFRNGAPLAACTDPAAAVPDPCYASRTSAAGGDVLITVRTSHFSTWSLGRPSYSVSGPFLTVAAAPNVNTADAGSAIPVTFKLGGKRGLDIFRAGYPTTTAFSCNGPRKYVPVKVTVPAKTSSLSYESITGTYVYIWKTAKTMTGCFSLDFVFHDGTSLHTLYRLR